MSILTTESKPVGRLAKPTRIGKEERPRSSKGKIRNGGARTLLPALFFLTCILLPQFSAAQEPDSNFPTHEILLIVGAPGEPEYATGFTKAAEQWKSASEATNVYLTTIGLDSSDTKDRDLIQQYLRDSETSGSTPLWIVYLGHGTFSSRDNLINLRGPDLALATITEWLEPFERPLIFVHGGSASAPFITALSGPNRIVITATRSSEEINYTRFGEYFARSLSLKSADLNQDDQISILEAFLFASDLSQKFYQEHGRLATEHALIDDNGDGAGTPHDWFVGTRVVKRSTDGRLPDGFRAHQISLVPSEQESRLTPAQRARRDMLERELETLRHSKVQYSEGDYYQRLESIFNDLSDIYLDDSSKSDQAGEPHVPVLPEDSREA